MYFVLILCDIKLVVIRYADIDDSYWYVKNTLQLSIMGSSTHLF